MKVWLILWCSTLLLANAQKTNEVKEKNNVHETFFGNTSLVSDTFRFVLNDGVPVHGTVLTGADTDLDFKVILTFGDTNANSITVWTAIDARKCDMRDLRGEVGLMATIVNSNGANEACKNLALQYAARTQRGVGSFCNDKNARSVAIPPIVFEQDITPTVSSDQKSFEFEMNLASLQRQQNQNRNQNQNMQTLTNNNPLDQSGLINILDNTGSDAVFRFTDVKPLFTGLRFRLEVKVSLVDRRRAAVCNRKSPSFSIPLCQYITIMTTLTNPGKTYLIEETFDLGTLLLDEIGEQDWLNKDGTFLVGENGLACQVAPDPFVITLQDVGAGLGQKPAGEFVSNASSVQKKAFLDSFSKSLKNEIDSNCLPGGYKIDPKSMANLEAKSDKTDPRVVTVHGNMYASAGKNPAGLLGCVDIVRKKMRKQNRTLKVNEFNLLIKKLWFRPGKFECDEEHEKYDACDGTKEPKAIVQQRTTKFMNRTTAARASSVRVKGGANRRSRSTTEKSLWSDLDGEKAETFVLVLIVIATVLLLALLSGFVVVKVMQRCARTRFYKMREQNANKGKDQALDEIAGEKQADRDVNVAAAAHVSHATADLQKLMSASGNSEEIEL